MSPTYNTQPTQTRHPWRATFRTVAAATVAFLPLLPEIVKVLGVESLPWVAAVIGVTGGVTRVLAMPGMDRWLRTWVPGLAAEPPKP